MWLLFRGDESRQAGGGALDGNNLNGSRPALIFLAFFAVPPPPNAKCLKS
jgi:hypothetical protein